MNYLRNFFYNISRYMDLRKNFLVLILALCLLVGGGVFAADYNPDEHTWKGESCRDQNQYSQDPWFKKLFGTHTFTCEWVLDEFWTPKYISARSAAEDIKISNGITKYEWKTEPSACKGDYPNDAFYTMTCPDPDPTKFNIEQLKAAGIKLKCHICSSNINDSDPNAWAWNETKQEDVCPEGQKKSLITWKCVCKDWEWWKTMEDGSCKKCDEEWVCCGIDLNTKVPFIWNCIEYNSGDVGWSAETANVDESTVFPVLMSAFTKILVTVILLMSFLAILAWGVMITASGGSDTGASKWKKLIGSVIIALALLGSSWIILRLINPNFFN